MSRRDADPRPEVEVLGAEAVPPPPARVELGSGGGRRRAVLLLTVVVVVLLGGLALGRDDDPPSTPAAEEPDVSTTTAPRRTTTTSSTSTTSLPVGPVFGQPTGGAILVHTTRRDWMWVELDSGVRRELSGLPADPYSLIPVRGGAVVVEVADAEFVPLPDGEPVRLGPADQVLPSGDADAVWLVRGFPPDGQGNGGLEGQLVDLQGRARSGVVEVPAGYVAGATRSTLVFSAGGRVYEADDSGVRPIAVGELIAGLPDGVLVRSCDDTARCDIARIDTRTGRVVTLDASSSPANYGFNAVAAEDGSLGLIDFSGITTLTLYDRDGRLLGSTKGPGTQEPWLQAFNGGLAWLPAGLGVILQSASGFDRMFAADGELVSEPIAALDGVRGDAVFVIPR